MSRFDQDSSPVFDFYKSKKKMEEASSSDYNLQEIVSKLESSQKLQIVILDVDTKAMSALSSLLKPRYDVYCLSSPNDVLTLVSTNRIALVISDQALPGANMLGVDLLLKVKEKAPFTTRILLAGHLDFGKAKYSLEKGDVFKLLKKPFNEGRMLELIDQAVEMYLHQSGGLANAAAKMLQQSPNFTKEISVAKIIPSSSNPALIKCSDKDFFDEIKTNYSDKAFFIHAEDRGATINVLETTIVKTLVYSFERTNILEDNEIVFLTQLKQELPHLTIIAIMNKDKLNYQEIINLLSNKIIFNYFPFNTKPEKICQQLSIAIEVANKLYNGPVYLKWPPPERIEEKEEEETIGEALRDVSSKVKGGVLSGIQSFKGLFKKKD